jgi:hypothetical protein
MALQHVRLLGEVFDMDAYRGGKQFVVDLMEAAHRSESRAECLCRAPAQSLYVAKRGETYYLARMPNTGPEHESNCVFYDPPIDQSGRSTLTDDAIIDLGGSFNIKLGFSLVESRNPTTSQRQGAAAPTTPAHRRAALDLLPALHFMWEASRNNIWFPVRGGQETQSRQWSRVCHFLNELIARTESGGKPLADAVFVAPPFRMDLAHEVRNQWRQALAPLVASRTQAAVVNGLPLLRKAVLGEVKEIAKTEFGYKLALKGSPVIAYMKPVMYERLKYQFPVALSALEGQTEVAKPNGLRCIALVVVEVGKKEHVHVHDMVLMATDRRYIPVSCREEAALSEQMIEAGRQFERPVDYGNAKLALPDFVLLDCDAPRVAMKVYPVPASIPEKERHRMVHQRYVDANQPYWKWEVKVSPVPPSLPTKRERKAIAFDT